MGEIDPEFIQETEYRPKFKTIEADEEIPVIDLSVSTPSDTKEVVSKIGEACKKWGFFQVINHGVPLELRQKIEKVAKEFFDQPMEEKRKVKRDEVNPMGYHDGEHTKNIRDWKEVFDFLVVDPTLIPASDDPDDKELRALTNQWPHKPSEFRELCQEYTRQVEKLAFKLLELISLSLGLPADRLNGYFKDQISFARFNHYPPCPAPHLALGVGRHKDGGALTVLSQDDVGGLQIGRRSDGEWIPVKPIPDAFIINIGNCMQVWSNDLYWSAEHRVVVNSQRERFSIPFFFFPSQYVDIKPLDELINEQNLAKYKEFNWGKFFACRNRSDYKKREVENIQIDHFKDWTLATTLMRETRLFNDQELSRDLVLTREKYGSVKRVFIIAEKDLALEKDFQQWMIQKNPPDEVKEIPGSDHMSMMSKPRELWACLQGISKKYN